VFDAASDVVNETETGYAIAETLVKQAPRRSARGFSAGVCYHTLASPALASD